MKTGKVIEFEKESVSKVPSNNDSSSNNSNNNDSGSKNNNGTKDNENEGNNVQDDRDFTIEQAKEVALKHAGLEIKDVIFTEAKQEYENGKLVYEIEFIYNGYEYDYEIDVATKEIIKYEKENS